MSLDTQLLASCGATLAWYDADWQYRFTVTIDPAMVSGSADLTDFPLLITLTDVDLKDAAHAGHVGQADGGDLLFTSADGTTQLDHEIESYDPATGTLVAWVKVPTLSPATDTVLYLYYGNAAAANQQNAAAVWSNGYAGV